MDTFLSYHSDEVNIEDLKINVSASFFFLFSWYIEALKPALKTFVVSVGLSCKPNLDTFFTMSDWDSVLFCRVLKLHESFGVSVGLSYKHNIEHHSF